MSTEIRLPFVPNPGTIDPSFCHLASVTDTDLMQAAAYRHYLDRPDGFIDVVVQFDCIRLYVEIGTSGNDVATWQDELYQFTSDWFQQHFPDCSIFNQDPPEAPPAIAELYEALGKPSMEQLAEVARWAVNGLAYGHHQMRFAWRTTYLCTHQTAFYEGIAGMATELIQHAAIDELHSTNLPDTAERRDGLIKQRDHWQSQLDGLEEMAPALHDADRQRLVISAHLATANQELELLETATA